MQAVFDDYEEGDVVWCQDYHLMLLPALLKARYPKMKVTTYSTVLLQLLLIPNRAGQLVENTSEVCMVWLWGGQRLVVRKARPACLE